ncbi:Xaa-Pro peptidase family protein [soil metagenome]
MTDIHHERQRRLRAVLSAAGVDAAIVPPSGDLVYLTGIDLHLSERLTLLVVPAEGAPTLVLPKFEADRIPPDLATSTWLEDDDPLPVLLAALPAGARTLAFGERVAASNLLGVGEALPETRLLALERVTGGVRAVKDDVELAALRGAAAATDRAFATFLESPLEGTTEAEAAARLALSLRGEGLATPFASCAAGANAASPHHASGTHVIARGEGVLFDFGGRFEGYLSDVSRTVVVGEASLRLREVHAAVARAQAAGLAVLRAGVRLGDVDAAARSSLARDGLAEAFTHRLGHGLGLEIHEPPYLTGGNDALAQAGHVVTVEPGVYLTGELGVRIEDDVLVTDDAHEVLTKAPRDLLVVP